MFFAFFLIVFLMSSIAVSAMEGFSKNTQVSEKVEPLTQIVAKKIFGYQRGNRNFKKTIKILQSLPDAAAKLIAQQGDQAGSTLMHTAAYLGNPELVNYLIGLGVDRRPRNKWGETPVILAVKQGNIDCFELLYIEEDSLERNDYDILLQYLLAVPGQQALKNVEKIENVFRNRMFPFLAAGGDFDYFKECLSRRNVSTKKLGECILNAAKAGAIQHLKLLLSKHPVVDANAINETLYQATLYKQSQAAQVLTDYGVTCDEILHCAVRSNCKKLIKLYCKKFPEQVNKLDDSLYTPLYYAASYGFGLTVNFLFKKRALANVKGENRSALGAALDSRNFEIAQVIAGHKGHLLDNESCILDNLIIEGHKELISVFLPEERTS